MYVPPTPTQPNDRALMRVGTNLHLEHQGVDGRAAASNANEVNSFSFSFTQDGLIIVIVDLSRGAPDPRAASLAEEQNE